MNVNGLILAAGLSSRMGDFKPLMKIKQQTVIEKTVESMLVSGVDQVVVVLGYRYQEVEKVLKKSQYAERIHLAYNPDYKTTDMLASIKYGMLKLPVCDAFFLLPGDMPLIASQTFFWMIDALDQSSAKVVFPLVNGRRKHPPLIHASCFKKILAFQGTDGLRALWREMEADLLEIPLEDGGCEIDLDTQRDYQRLLSYLIKC